MTPLATVMVWRMVSRARSRSTAAYRSASASARRRPVVGDEEPQRIQPVVAGSAVVEERDELLTGPAVVAGVA
jgi:hypothetical protein